MRVKVVKSGLKFKAKFYGDIKLKTKFQSSRLVKFKPTNLTKSQAQNPNLPKSGPEAHRPGAAKFYFSNAFSTLNGNA
ncbi:hypothetical protein [Campylobacter rectus]|uniref:hypothetical protein n=1 Tax=Campylobacter rectus TaxID=203 RepID=UPI0023F18C57|nr:hypothetical protein [Campylobacter rectus]